MSLDVQKPVPIPIDVQVRDGDLQSISKEMRDEVFRWQLETRPEKFEKFLKRLQYFRYAVCSCVRGDLMEYYYCAMRFPDDVGDGDHPVPNGYATGSDYIRDKLAFARNPSNPKDAIDQVLLYCYELAEQLGFDLHSESANILESVLFDAEREGKSIPYPQDVLSEYFYKMDITGTIAGSLKIYGETECHHSDLEDLGIATRVYYNIRDIREDLNVHGLINIPQEEMDRYGIEVADLKNPDSLFVKEWLRKEALYAKGLILDHSESVSTLKLRRITRLTLDRVYVRPAMKFLQNFLSKSHAGAIQQPS